MGRGSGMYQGLFVLLDSVHPRLFQAAAVSCYRRCNISTCQEQGGSKQVFAGCLLLQGARSIAEKTKCSSERETPPSYSGQKFSLAKSVVYFKDPGNGADTMAHTSASNFSPFSLSVPLGNLTSSI